MLEGRAWEQDGAWTLQLPSMDPFRFATTGGEDAEARLIVFLGQVAVRNSLTVNVSTTDAAGSTATLSFNPNGTFVDASNPGEVFQTPVTSAGTAITDPYADEPLGSSAIEPAPTAARASRQPRSDVQQAVGAVASRRLKVILAPAAAVLVIGAGVILLGGQGNSSPDQNPSGRQIGSQPTTSATHTLSTPTKPVKPIVPVGLSTSASATSAAPGVTVVDVHGAPAGSKILVTLTEPDGSHRAKAAIGTGQLVVLGFTGLTGGHTGWNVIVSSGGQEQAHKGFVWVLAPAKAGAGPTRSPTGPTGTYTPSSSSHTPAPAPYTPPPAPKPTPKPTVNHPIGNGGPPPTTPQK